MYVLCCWHTGHEEQGNLQGVRPGNVSARFSKLLVDPDAVPAVVKDGVAVVAMFTGGYMTPCPCTCSQANVSGLCRSSQIAVVLLSQSQARVHAAARSQARHEYSFAFHMSRLHNIHGLLVC